MTIHAVTPVGRVCHAGCGMHKSANLPGPKTLTIIICGLDFLVLFVYVSASCLLSVVSVMSLSAHTETEHRQPHARNYRM